MSASAGPEVVDTPFIRVPFEALKRSAKDRKSYVDHVAESVTAVAQQRKTPAPRTPAPEEQDADEDEPASASGVDLSAGPASREEHLESLEKLIENLKGMKRKLGDVGKSEKAEAQRCKARLEHLKTIGVPGKSKIIAWNKQRLDRILVDHLLRQGHQQTATHLAKEAGIEDLVDAHIFKEAGKVTDALKRHDCSVALAWCAENRARLKKIKSKFEFKLRVQEFIELVRQDKRLDAIQYARTYLAPWAPLYMQELQRAVATLAFTCRTTCPPYSALFEEGAWAALSDLFHRELYRLHALTPESLLVVHLQAGLSALKTPLSYQAGCSKEDPLHLPTFQKLAEGLPYAKHVQSKLVCSVTKDIMNDANPPMVLPNGYVYSARAVESITAANGGRMVCPRTGNVYAADELRRAFIV